MPTMQFPQQAFAQQGFPQQAFPQQAFPQPTYAQQAYPGFPGQPVAFPPGQPQQAMPAGAGGWAAAPQTMPQQPPVQQQPVQQQAVRPQPRVNAPSMPVLASLAVGGQSAPETPRPTIRLQSEDPPQTVSAARLTLPTPEDLGLSAVRSTTQPRQATPAPLDWNNAHARLQRLGALAFHVDRLAEGNVRVTFQLPTSQPQRTHQIEVVADNEGSAMNTALEQAERWTSGR